MAGSGPAGLTVAADLAKMGCLVTLFESLHLVGECFPTVCLNSRLPKIVAEKLAYIQSLGVEIKTDTLIGKTFLAIFLKKAIRRGLRSGIASDFGPTG